MKPWKFLFITLQTLILYWDVIWFSHVAQHINHICRLVQTFLLYPFCAVNMGEKTLETYSLSFFHLKRVTLPRELLRSSSKI